MSNSFNISVKPEIAAAVVKIDAIKADTGPIRNDVTAIHDTNLPAVKVDTGAIRNDVTAIHDIGLPSVIADCAALRNDVTDIHDTEIPIIKTNTISILNRANAIKAKTDTIPQKFRGSVFSVKGTADSDSWTSIIDVTGSGMLLLSLFRTLNGADTIEYRIVYDGHTSVVISHTGDTLGQSIIVASCSNTANIISLSKLYYTVGDMHYINLEFNVSLEIQIRRSAGTADSVESRTVYYLDGV